MQRRLGSASPLFALTLASLVACSGGESDDGQSSFTGTGGAAENPASGGTSGETPGTGGGGLGTGGQSGDGGGVATGGAATGIGGSPLGDGGSLATGGISESSGGADGSGGTDASGGADATGGADGSGGADTGVDADGCPTTQRGFSTLNSLGQDGTTGGDGGQVVTVTNQADLEQYAGADGAYVIRVEGTITVSPKGKEINVTSDKTIIGIGATGEINEGGFILREGVHNVIIRNLTIGNTFKADDPSGDTQDWDGVQMDTAHHVWIDHCDFHHGGDGLIDSRKDTTNLTVSWTYLRDHNKTFGIGWTENVTAEMTIHHNVIRNTQQRNPSTDNVLRAHLYNNWLENVTSYGNYARGGTNMVLENSVFEDVNNPHYYDTGSLVAIGNSYSGTSGQQESSGSSYSFFDPSDFYDYDLDGTNEVKSLLTECAGPRPTLGH